MVVLIIKKIILCLFVATGVYSVFRKLGLPVVSVVTFTACFALEMIFYINQVWPARLMKIPVVYQGVNHPVVQHFWGAHYYENFPMVYFIAIWLFCTTIYIIRYLTKKDPMEKAQFLGKLKRDILLFAGGVFLIYGATSNRIDVTHYTIQVEGLPQEMKGLKILQISDLHSTIYPDNQQRLIDLVIQEEPDFIFLTGDIADDNIEFTGTRLLLEGITGIAPIYYVTGNHEYWAADFREINSLIQSMGVIALENNYTVVQYQGYNLFIGGIDDPFSYMRMGPTPSMKERIETLGLSAETIEAPLSLLLSHRPEFAREYGDTPFDIVFSGHAHGGQVRIPFTNIAGYAPDQGLFPTYNSGVYSLEGGTHLVVSRGLAYRKDIPRIFNMPHLVVVEVY